MAWPRPEPGLVIRYAYLWRREQVAGQEEGRKDRPCAIILAVAHGSATDPTVIVLPITHAAPRDPADGVELPAATKRRLGLDDARSWVITSEANRFAWPGPDLRPLPGAGMESVAYGMLPPALFRVIRDRFLAGVRRRAAGVVTRTE